MIIAKVIGSIVSTQKNKNLVGAKLLLVQPLDEKGHRAGDELVAVDGVGAGEGDLVLCICEGGSARQVYNNSKSPIDTVIAGIIDVIECEDGTMRI